MANVCINYILGRLVAQPASGRIGDLGRNGIESTDNGTSKHSLHIGVEES